MPSIARHLTRVAQSLQHLGPLEGAAAYQKFLLSRMPGADRSTLRSIRIPGVPEPVWIRPGTSDWHVLEQVFFRREYDFDLWRDQSAAIQDQYERILASGRIPLILDLGANVGLSALWFWLRFPKARIYAVEPELSNFRVLALNTASLAMIRPVHAGASDRKTTICMSNASGQPWAWESTEDIRGDIETVTVNELVAADVAHQLLLAKIDIEGAETTLFRSNYQWVKLAPLIVVEIHDWLGGWRGTGDAVFSALTQHKREYIYKGENIFSFSHDLVKSADGS